jgi:hypothetical protein
VQVCGRLPFWLQIGVVLSVTLTLLASVILLL